MGLGLGLSGLERITTAQAFEVSGLGVRNDVGWFRGLEYRTGFKDEGGGAGLSDKG